MTEPVKACVVLAGLDAAVAAAAMATWAVGPLSLRGGGLWPWLMAWAAYLAVSAGFAATFARSWLGAAPNPPGPSASGPAGRGHRPGPALRLLAFESGLLCTFGCLWLVAQFRPDVPATAWSATSTIQPFPLLAGALVLTAVALARLALAGEAAWRGSATNSRKRPDTPLLASRLGIAASLLLMGAFQATAYVVPINNATLRYWAIADGIFLGQGYPLTLTEPGPISAGSPPYVYDLPLFPLIMKGTFLLLGHNSVAAHVPSLIFCVLFPLSLYLLIREATGSGLTALLFTALTSSFPLLRLWVLNLPDPDPFFLTSLCFAAYLYLKALEAPRDGRIWLSAGFASGVVSLARPEGALYAGCLALGLLATRPGIRQYALYAVPLGLFLAPMVVLWFSNFGFLWPQNYNRTLALDHPIATYGQLDTEGGLPMYYRGLGLSAEWGLAILAAFVLCSLLGTAAMLMRGRPLLAFTVPAIGNTVLVFFTDPWISNAFQYADFFRHASFGIPLMTVACAYWYQAIWRRLASRGRPGTAVAGVLAAVLVLAVVREGDILANPTATHRPGSPLATQVLTDYPYLSLQGIVENPMQLPPMGFYRDEAGMLVAYVPGMQWPEDALAFFKRHDMSYDSRGRAFGYAAVVAFLAAIGFHLRRERP